jgi:two-component system cell cycle sensor histidine kinase/response regulator CckA
MNYRRAWVAENGVFLPELRNESPRIAGSVLVVEDESLIALDLQRRLMALGYCVPGIAATADDAVELAAAYMPDLILMDIRLRGQRDGISTAGEIRARLDIPVVFLTAHADLETLQRARQTDPFGYIVKHFGSTDLRAQIEIARNKHQTERKIRRSEAWLAAALASVGEAVIIAGFDSVVEGMNPLAERLTGWREAQAKGRDVTDVFVVVDAETSRPVVHPCKLLRSSLAGGLQGDGAAEAHRVQAEYRLFGRGGGSPLIRAVVSANRNDEGPLGLVFAFREIGEGGELQRRCPEVEQIRGAGKMGSRLAQDLLRASRSDVVTSEILDWNALIRSSEKMLSQIVSPASTLGIETCDEPLFVRSDQTQLRQVLVNLATNARDAMPRGGNLSISTSVHAGVLGEMVVGDSGTGMTAATLDRIFEPYFSLKGTRGTGLGMAIVHNIVSRWGGSVSVRSELGEGSVFTIRLPLVPAPDAGELTEAPAVSSFTKTTPAATILLVEDHDDIREMLSEELTSAGFEVVSAEDGESGLAQLQLQKRPIDLLITDVMMPRMTGCELAKHCVDACPAAKVLFISGYSKDELRGNPLLQTGQAVFLAKPMTPAEVLSMAMAMLARPT